MKDRTQMVEEGGRINTMSYIRDLHTCVDDVAASNLKVLNKVKTCAIRFGLSGRFLKAMKVIVRDITLAQATFTRLLGFTVDGVLSWDTHIDEP